jgi:hypothetical protein
VIRSNGAYLSRAIRSQASSEGLARVVGEAVLRGHRLDAHPVQQEIDGFTAGVHRVSDRHTVVDPQTANAARRANWGVLMMS